MDRETVVTQEKTELRQRQVPSRDGAPEMFDRISRRYDLLNHLLSFGLDLHWRKQAVKQIDALQAHTILDLACGTGDLALAAIRACQNKRLVVGVDMAPQMLDLAQKKVSGRGLRESCELIRGDGMALPILANSCDAAMIAFGIRNMPDTGVCLAELNRVLKPGGRLVVLEFSMPGNRLIRSLYLPYFRYLLPCLGRMISGDNYAYRYLDRTVETYSYGEEFVRLMDDVGFTQIVSRPLTFGVVTIYTGEKS